MKKKIVKKVKRQILNFTEQLLFDLGEFFDRFFIPSGTYEKIRNYELWKLKQKERKEFKEKQLRKKFAKALYEFQRRGYIENQKLTPKGMIKLLRKKKKWDNHWRFVLMIILKK